MNDPFQRQRQARMANQRPSHVPFSVAERLAAERDRLMAEREQLVAQRKQLAAERDELAEALEGERARREAAEEAVEELRAQRAEPVEAEPQDDLIDQMHRRIASLTDDLRRGRERAEREVEDARRRERARLLSGLGDVLDSVDRALDSIAEESPWRAGLVAIQSQLAAFIAGEGAQLIGAVGETMDPRLHEAVGVVSAPGVARGEVVGVARRGIVLEDGSVARTAQVVVAE